MRITSSKAMSGRKNIRRLPDGIRLACPLGCEKGFLNISQLKYDMLLHQGHRTGAKLSGSEHVFSRHSGQNLKPRGTTDPVTRTISPDKLGMLRAASQETRLKSPHRKIQELSRILNHGKGVPLYHLPASIYKQTANAAVNGSKTADLFLEAMVATMRTRRGFRVIPKPCIVKALCIIKSFLSAVDQDGIFFIEGEWQEMKRHTNQGLMSSHGLRYACPLGCGKGFLSISQLKYATYLI